MDVEYNHLTVKKLKEIINDRGIHVNSRRPKKADLIAAIRASDRESAPPGVAPGPPLRLPSAARTTYARRVPSSSDLTYGAPPLCDVRSQGTQFPTPDPSPAPSAASSRRPSISRSSNSRRSTKSSTSCSPFLLLIFVAAAGAGVFYGAKFLNTRIPALDNLHDYAFVPNQNVVNDEISTAIFNWNSRADEPDGALALHLAGGDMNQLQDIAKRIHYVVNTLPDSPGRGKYKLVNLNDDFRSCQGSKNKRQCLEQQMSTHLKSHSGCVVFTVDASTMDFEEDLTFLTAFTDDTAGYIPSSSGNMKVNKAALVLLSNFGAHKFPRLTSSDAATQEEISKKTFYENKGLITRHSKGNAWSDRFTHRLEAQVPVLSSNSGVVPSTGDASDL